MFLNQAYRSTCIDEVNNMSNDIFKLLQEKYPEVCKCHSINISLPITDLAYSLATLLVLLYLNEHEKDIKITVDKFNSEVFNSVKDILDKITL